MTWLVLGANGQLGRELIYLLRSLNVEVIGTDRKEIDFEKPEEIHEKLRKLSPTHIVNCGAYTQVDKAEDEPELAHLINGQAPGMVARYALESYIPFVHISTDYVFDGNSVVPYKEEDKTNPQSVYGESKLLGEDHVMARNPKAYILRTAWVYGAHGNNFPKIIASKLRNKEPLSVVDDQVGSPTWTFDLAKAIIEIIEKTPKPGVYHITNDDFCSWFDFAQTIAKTLEIDTKNIKPTDSKTFIRPAARPKFSVLSNKKWKTSGLTPLRSWQDAWQEAAPTVLIND